MEATTSTQNQEEPRNETVTSTEPSEKLQEKTRAGEDVIKYAETHELEGIDSSQVKEKKKPKEEAKSKEPFVKGVNRGTGKEVEVPLSTITSISRYIYVHNIFDPTPVIEHIQYKVIAPNTLYVTFDITEEVFNELVALPAYKGKVHYNYIDDMAKNDPAKNGFYHRTFSVKYPEWITPEDIQKQAQGIVSHYGVPNLTGIEKLLWPNFDGKIKKRSLSSEDSATVIEPEVVEEEPAPEE